MAGRHEVSKVSGDTFSGFGVSLWLGTVPIRTGSDVLLWFDRWRLSQLLDLCELFDGDLGQAFALSGGRTRVVRILESFG
ncbi:hypothetical protein AXA44_40560 [Rhodococcus sp. SC4]|nr:hypothetical protein AXA44_40560 [Rhodococcus sp. SC4]